MAVVREESLLDAVDENASSAGSDDVVVVEPPITPKARSESMNDPLDDVERDSSVVSLRTGPCCRFAGRGK